MCVSRSIESIVVCAGHPPNCVGGSRCLVSQKKLISSVAIVEKSLPTVFSRVMGRYTLGSSYIGLSGFLSTTIVDSLYSLGCMFSLKIALKMKYKQSASTSMHCLRTALGTPSGPGALNALSLAAACFIWSLEKNWKYLSAGLG